MAYGKHDFVLFLQFDPLWHAWIVREQQRRASQFIGQRFLANRNPAVDARHCFLGDDHRLAVLILGYLDFWLGAKTQDDMRLYLEQAVEHPLVLRLGTVP